MVSTLWVSPASACGCRQQVESVAVAKHGSLDAIDQQRQQKVKQKIEERAKKRKSAEDSSQSEAAAHQQQLEAVLNKYSSKLIDQEGEQ